MSSISFNEQVAIVTGAGRGLGRAYALELARRGARVVVNDIGRSPDGAYRADLVAAEIAAAGGEALASRHDVATAQGGEELVAAAQARFGRLDVLINNAGFLRPGGFEDLNLDEVRAIVEIHLLAAFYVTIPAWKLMRQAGYGRVVMTGSSSMFGHHSNSNYGAAKAGVFGLVHSLAREGREFGIGVNCVLPLSDTQIAREHPLRGPEHDRLKAAVRGVTGRRPPESVAHLVTYLASAACTVSGRAYSAAAGRYARVFVGVSKGWFENDGANVNAEAIARHFDEINDVGAFDIPTSLIDEIEEIVARIAGREPEPTG